MYWLYHEVSHAKRTTILPFCHHLTNTNFVRTSTSTPLPTIRDIKWCMAFLFSQVDAGRFPTAYHLDPNAMDNPEEMAEVHDVPLHLYIGVRQCLMKRSTNLLCRRVDGAAFSVLSSVGRRCLG